MPPLRIFSKWFEVAGRTYDAFSNLVLDVMSRMFFTVFDVMIHGVQSFVWHLSLCLLKPSFWLFKVFCLNVWQLSGMLRKEKLFCVRMLTYQLQLQLRRYPLVLAFRIT